MKYELLGAKTIAQQDNPADVFQPPLIFVAWRTMRPPAMTWRVTSFLCLGAGCYQAYEVAGRVRHLTTIAWKMGMDSFGLITAGVVMIVVFFLFAAVFVVLGLITADHFLKQRSWFSLPAILGTQILIAGALIWGAMLASPYVEIVNR